ncbi:transcription antiterminator [Staphylococcus chromogenes]|uniref:glucose PTS transporter transcription antiterminator GlcT n=1 Tax=Staphylococcus chromogenes TaxID=46126 RepID=UPI000D1AA60E|nr:transcription antiterminator [Staphylococcus chromogenes]PTG65975.1 transcriptional regulator [Staphylococcus chromogenes]RIM09883.1 transcription antiterminator [Staphylococcus chromogenes]
MPSYLIKKVLNNNVLICEYCKEEVIVIGKGLGFNQKAGKYIEPDKVIEKIFTLQNKQEQDHYKMVLEHTDEDVVKVVIESVQLIMAHFDLSQNESFIVSLTDHIVFALKRYQQNQFIQNPFLSETKYSYPEAYKIAKRVVARINLQLNVDFPDDEVGFIALHIASQTNQIDIEQTQQVPKLIKTAVKIIEHDLQIKIPVQSIQYQRFVRHIHFLLQRVRNGERAHVELNFETLLKSQYPLCYNIAVKIVKMIQTQSSVEVYQAEIAYLTMHIQQLSTTSQSNM